MFAFQTIHSDYRLLVVEKSKILRFCLCALNGDDKQLTIAPLKSSPSRHQLRPLLSLTRQALLFMAPTANMRGMPPRRPCR